MRFHFFPLKRNNKISIALNDIATIEADVCIIYHLPQIAHFLHGIVSVWKQGPDAVKTADSSLQSGCTGSGPAVSLPQSFFLPKELRQTWDQFPRQTSKLCLSHLTHTLFFWRGWRWWAAKIQAPQGANYHIEEICLVFQEDNVRHETHIGSHTHTDTFTQADWRRHKCTSWCSSIKKRVCKHVCVHTSTQNAMHSHIQSHKWVIICTYREKKREPEIAEM